MTTNDTVTPSLFHFDRLTTQLKVEVDIRTLQIAHPNINDILEFDDETFDQRVIKFLALLRWERE